MAGSFFAALRSGQNSLPENPGCTGDSTVGLLLFGGGLLQWETR